MYIILNKKNFLYRNYCVRQTAQGWQLVDYAPLMEEVAVQLAHPEMSYSGTPCPGNWHNSTYYAGLVPYVKNKVPLFESIEAAKVHIDTLCENNFKVGMNPLWFFICLVHLTEPFSEDVSKRKLWNFSYFKPHFVDSMLDSCGFEVSISSLFNSGEYADYFIKECKSSEGEPLYKLNKNVLFAEFANELLRLSKAVL